MRAARLQASAALVLALAAAAAAAPPRSLFDFAVTDLQGRQRHMSEFRGKALLVVNVASQCGFTDANYRGLQQLHDKYHGRGLEVLAFPCNQFGGQEPGSAADILSFVRDRYRAAFPLMEKMDVNGPNQAPLWAFLKAHAPAGPGEQQGADVGWNFVKILVDRSGRPVKRYGWDFQQAVIEADVEALLADAHSEL